MTETTLPGVGVRYDFTTSGGREVGVIVHHGGRREVVLYDDDRPDECVTMLDVGPDDARTMAELLGATRVSEVTAAVQQEIEGLAIDWIRIAADSEFAGRSLADADIRSRTGVSVVALLRGDETVPAPGPDMVLDAGDVAVAVGTVEALERARQIIGVT